ncbi:hypothetical protein HZH68_014097 [Vespula germanica]|uniref:Uncharacterized protein n=1 Tax=Vespula germanica TaxID=30212 RepID=A0A834MU17_VESGE|nr:hypothetical protein HZH68_014097 [Vespula germanica]
MLRFQEFHRVDVRESGVERCREEKRREGGEEVARRWVGKEGGRDRREQTPVECTVGKGGGRRVWFLWKHIASTAPTLVDPTGGPTRVASVTVNVGEEGANWKRPNAATWGGGSGGGSGSGSGSGSGGSDGDGGGTV